MRATGQRISDQAAVWMDIREKAAKFHVPWETSAMSDIFEQEAGRLEDYVAAFRAMEGQSGAVFAIGGKVAGIELFDSAETLRKLFPKLLRSYGLDALDRAGSKTARKETPCAPEAARSFLEKTANAKAEDFAAISEGRDIRLSGRGLTGAALLADDRIIQLTAFSTN
jgi:hypothetical protein